MLDPCPVVPRDNCVIGFDLSFLVLFFFFCFSGQCPEYNLKIIFHIKMRLIVTGINSS
jgi:hypothetical protein